jgi:hypothetical protein
MKTLLIFGGIFIALAWLGIRFAAFIKKCDLDIERMTEESKRTDDLIREAQAQYPRASLIEAITLYVDDLESQILQLKSLSWNTDTYVPLRQLLQAKRILVQEKVRLMQVELDSISGFSIPTSAQA